MSPFEFICAFYSVVLGVAVAQLMTSVGRLLEVRDQVRTYWVHSLWVMIVLVIDVNSWWTMWELRSAKSWSFISFSLLVGFVASIYLVTVLLFPRIPESEGQIDLCTHYYKNRQIFFLSNAAGWTLAMLCNLSFLPIRSWLNPEIIIPVIVVILSVVAAVTGNRRYHAAFAIFVLALLAFALLRDPTTHQMNASVKLKPPLDHDLHYSTNILLRPNDVCEHGSNRAMKRIASRCAASTN